MMVVSQLGARMHYAVPRIFHASGQLELFATDFYAPGILARMRSRLPKIAGQALRAAGRYDPQLEGARIRSFQSLGLRYWFRRRYSGEDLRTIFLQTNGEFCRKVCALDWGKADSVYTFNSAGKEILELARSRGMRCIMEQTIAPISIERDIIRQAALDFPDLLRDDSYSGDSFERFRVREAEEWRLADRILCGSEFVKDGIAAAGGPTEKCIVVPYGVDSDKARARQRSWDGPTSRRLRLVAVGSMGIRKGIPYLLEAASALSEFVDLRLVGPLETNRICDKAPSNVEIVGPVPRSEVWRHYDWADVFILPSLCEGSATVTYEARALGLPVITTPNTGSTVVDGMDGLIVDGLSSNAIVDAVRRLLQNSERVVEMSHEALERSSKDTVAAYSKRLIEACS